MDSHALQASHAIRLQFTQAMSAMYQQEVPLYQQLRHLAQAQNRLCSDDYAGMSDAQIALLACEHHGAIRLGKAAELATMRRLFAVMGMHPVDYYDLSAAGIPVHSTAFRPIVVDEFAHSPFRVFCSLLRLDLIENTALRQQAENILSNRNIFPEQLLKLIETAEKQGGLTPTQAELFITQALDVFRWHQHATVDKSTYDALKAAHGLVADVVSFKGPHINHLTPKVLDIDACQQQFAEQNINAKALVEGPPKRNCPILLRQTSFIAIAEPVIFSEGVAGSHTARFGEIEQRGIALTPKGRALYDELLAKARHGDEAQPYADRLAQAFAAFPDSYSELRQQGLAYFQYSTAKNNEKTNEKQIVTSTIEELVEQGYLHATPITYEDFLPVSAAGIFTSNLAVSQRNESQSNASQQTPASAQQANRAQFENDLGASLKNSFALYQTQQDDSLKTALATLGLERLVLGD